MAEEMKNQELENEEETKATENNQEQENDQDNAGVPAEVPDEKKGFHPIQGIKNWGHNFAENHPNVVSGAKTAVKVGVGVVVGAVGTVTVLASVAAKNGQAVEDDDSDYNQDDDESVVDSTATEVDDQQ